MSPQGNFWALPENVFAGLEELTSLQKRPPLEKRGGSQPEGSRICARERATGLVIVTEIQKEP